MHTVHTVMELIQDNWESDLPQRVLAALRPMHGKMVTMRLLDKLPGGKDKWRLRREYGMTHIENKEYFWSAGADPNGICLLVDWRVDSFPLDVDKLEERNLAYFKGRQERNHRRMEAKNNHELLQKMANVLNKIEAACQALDEAKAEFEDLTGYGKPFSADNFELERACGLRVEK